MHCDVCFLALYEKAEIKAPEDKNKHVIIGVSSDRGLCGAIHSNVAKAMKSEIAKLSSAGKEVMVVNVGDKLRGLLYRYISCLPFALSRFTFNCFIFRMFSNSKFVLPVNSQDPRKAHPDQL